MASEPPAATPPETPAPAPAPPPPPPGPDASREEWHAWRRRQRDYVRAQWMHGSGWYGRGWGWFGWGWFWGAALVLLGIYFLLSNLGLLGWLRGDVVWPVLLILFGIALIAGRGRWWR